MIHILTYQHHAEHTACDRHSGWKRIHKHVTQKCMVNLLIIVLLCQKKCRNTNCTGTDQRHLDRFKGIGIPEEDRDQRQQHGKNRLDQKHGCCSTDIIYNPASLVHNLRHRRKIGIQQYHICNILSSITTLSHGNTAVCLFKSQNIVYAITGHRNRMLLCLQRLYHRLLLLRCHTSEHTVCCNCLVHLFLGCDRCCIYILLRIFKACTSGYGRNGHRIITGDHLQIHPLAFEICQGIRCLLADHIRKKKKSDRLKPCRDLSAFIYILTVSNNQNTKSFFRKTAAVFCQLRIPFRKKKLHSTHQISACIFKSSSTVLSVRRERDHMIQLHILGYFKSRPQCIGSSILVFQHRKEISHDMLDLPDFLRIFLAVRLCASFRLFPW